MTNHTLPTVPTIPSGPAPAPVAAPGPLPYHLLARGSANNRWWRPLTTLAVAAVTYVGLALLLVIGAMAVAVANPGFADQLTQQAAEWDQGNPAIAALELLAIALLLPAIVVGVRVGGGRPAGFLSSVAGRLRWDLLGRNSLVALAIMLAGSAISLVMAAVSGTPIVPRWDAASLGLLACALLLVPFQAAAEEYAFRALPMQLLGTWLRSPWWGILVPLPFFVIGHQYDAVGLANVALFAVAAGVLTWRTGGLEAAIALHVVNNALGYGFSAFGLSDPNATVIPVADALVSGLAIVAYTAIVLWRTSPRDAASASAQITG
ncbi:CPBP family intramembrane glutamic endopeptidase [Nigerium sp.]|uniref:CPBP family intramembrane glutamic endopeptidase n=1 Tax=Nigerium sp. TaxID=2042655 RepID=UPI00322153A6